jgi:hypothetical protein
VSGPLCELDHLCPPCLAGQACIDLFMDPVCGLVACMTDGHTDGMVDNKKLPPNEKNTADRPPATDGETAAASTAEVPPVTTEYTNPEDIERDSVDEDKSNL